MRSSGISIDKLLELMEEGKDQEAEKAVSKQHLTLREPGSNESVLHKAVRKGLPLLTKRLLQLGADPYLVNKQKESPLLLAFKANDEELVAIILNSQSVITEDVGRVILFLVLHNDLKSMQRLLEKADKSTIEVALKKWKFGEGNTALHYTVSENQIEMTKLLMEYGADPEAKNHEGKSAIDLAEFNKDKNPEILSVVRRKVNVNNNSNNNSLQKKNLKQVKEGVIKDKELYSLYYGIKVSNKPDDALLDKFVHHVIKNIDNLDAGEIGLILNLIGKLRDISGPKYWSLLRVLAKRSEDIAEEFNSQDIALVYNFISKLSNPDAECWQPMLGALANRAKEIAKEFNSQHIALAYNFISKLSNPDAERWQPMLRALAERAIEIVSTFTSEELYNIHILLYKLNENNRKALEPLLLALNNQAAIKVENYNKKLQEFKQKNPQARGRNISRYEGFINMALNNNLDFNNLNKLGNIEKYNDGYYFKPSKESNDCLISLLNVYYSKEENITAIKLEQQEKCEKDFLTSPSYEEKVLEPGCVSAIAATIDDKKYCFIAASSLISNKILNAIDKAVEDLNQRQKEVEYVVIKNNSADDFSDLLYFLTQDKEAYKRCSEKSYAKLLAKLYAEYGDRLRVTGISNCFLYPYQKGKYYGAHEKSIDRFVVAPNYKEMIEIDNNIMVNFIRCCKQCMKLKPAVFHIFQTAQNHGRELANQNEIKRERYFSPIRHSFFSATPSLAEREQSPSVSHKSKKSFNAKRTS